MLLNEAVLVRRTINLPPVTQKSSNIIMFPDC